MIWFLVGTISRLVAAVIIIAYTHTSIHNRIPKARTKTHTHTHKCDANHHNHRNPKDAREKGELLRNLMREAHASSAAPAAAAGVPMLSKLWRAGVKTASGAAALATGRKARRGADLAEMEHIAEEALLDNMRLRRDLRTIAEEC